MTTNIERADRATWDASDVDRVRQELQAIIDEQAEQIKKLTRLASDAIGGAVSDFELLLGCERQAQQKVREQAKQIKAKDKALALALPIFQQMAKFTPHSWGFRISGTPKDWDAGAQILEQALKEK